MMTRTIKPAGLYRNAESIASEFHGATSRDIWIHLNWSRMLQTSVNLNRNLLGAQILITYYLPWNTGKRPPSKLDAC